jgi:hypothetical protein
MPAARAANAARPQHALHGLPVQGLDQVRVRGVPRAQIITNPDAVPAPAEKAYMGHSVGHWDGSTLVVETKDFKQAMWLDVEGTPLSANGKLTQRIRKVDNGDREPYLEIITTIDDPVYYTKPWSVVRSFGWTPNLAYHKEYNCEEQIGDRSVDADAGLVPEPKD